SLAVSYQRWKVPYAIKQINKATKQMQDGKTARVVNIKTMGTIVSELLAPGLADLDIVAPTIEAAPEADIDLLGTDTEGLLDGLDALDDIGVDDEGSHDDATDYEAELTAELDTIIEDEPAAEVTEAEPEDEPAAEVTEAEPEDEPVAEVTEAELEDEPASEVTEAEPEAEPEDEPASEVTEAEPEAEPEDEPASEVTEAEPEDEPAPEVTEAELEGAGIEEEVSESEIESEVVTEDIDEEPRPEIEEEIDPSITEEDLKAVETNLLALGISEDEVKLFIENARGLTKPELDALIAVIQKEQLDMNEESEDSLNKSAESDNDTEVELEDSEFDGE
ncbi:MAG: hypothetical protein ACTSV2_00420, partial [Candidatus Thorarchaeota archaeon]